MLKKTKRRPRETLKASQSSPPTPETRKNNNKKKKKDSGTEILDRNLKSHLNVYLIGTDPFRHGPPESLRYQAQRPAMAPSRSRIGRFLLRRLRLLPPPLLPPRRLASRLRPQDPRGLRRRRSSPEREAALSRRRRAAAGGRCMPGGIRRSHAM